jgi:putative hydrolase of the HAD superfamily
MIIEANDRSYFVFDLDDTLYSEIDFVKSAFKFIAFNTESDLALELYEKMLQLFLSGGNAFSYVLEKFPGKQRTIDDLLYIYRNHIPEISLKEGVFEMLTNIKSKNGQIGLITNGRYITQRNKIEALKLEQIIDDTIISEQFGFEKPNEEVFKYFQKKNQKSNFFYFGDNLKIDFISPKRLGWYCIGIIDENAIHRFSIADFSQEYLPHAFIKKYTEIEII